MRVTLSSGLALVLALAGCGDSTTTDAGGSIDSGSFDGGNVDAGGADAGPSSDGGADSGSDAGDAADAGSTDAGSTDAGSTDAGSSSDAGPPRCPPSLPTPSTACDTGLDCSYGTDPRFSCRPRARCTGGTWLVTVARCTVLDGASCPSTRPAPASSCTGLEGTTCTYGDAVCGCTNCRGGPCGGPGVWICSDPPVTTGCPPTAPNLGETCSGSPDCRYGSCSTGTQARLICSSGVWTFGFVVCPL